MKLVKMITQHSKPIFISESAHRWSPLLGRGKCGIFMIALIAATMFEIPALAAITSQHYVDTMNALNEKIANKTTTVTAASTDAEYPSARAVYTGLAAKVDSSALAPVATSGSYNDLADKPASAQIQSDFTQMDAAAPDYVKNKPTLGTAAAAAATDFATAAQGLRADNAVLTTPGTQSMAGTYTVTGALDVPTPPLPVAL